jgi:AGCS family alanine or glycine:cation symporter
VIRLILSSAFQGEAIFGGFLGAMVAGFRRAAFSNEAGIGSAAIAHSAAKTDQPAREGFVALLEPFIDTIVICTMTASVILITAPENVSLQKLRTSQHNVYNAKQQINALKQQAATLNPNDKGAMSAFQKRERVAISALRGAEAEHKKHQKGTELTSRAFESVVPWFPYLLALAVFLFAYSTMISWSYYGEQGWEFLFGARSIVIYRLLFLGAVVLGSVSRLDVVIDFSDMMILLCAFPNIIGLFLMREEVKTHVDDYWKKYKNNEFKTFR